MPRDQEKALEPLELELQEVLSRLTDMGAGESSNSQPLPCLSSPLGCSSVKRLCLDLIWAAWEEQQGAKTLAHQGVRLWTTATVQEAHLSTTTLWPLSVKSRLCNDNRLENAHGCRR